MSPSPLEEGFNLRKDLVGGNTLHRAGIEFAAPLLHLVAPGRLGAGVRWTVEFFE